MRSLKNYKIELSISAKKDLKVIEIKMIFKIQSKLNALTQDIPNLDIKKLVGLKTDLFRLRCGDYRIIADLKKQQLQILVIKIGHRKNIYDWYFFDFLITITLIKITNYLNF